MKKILIGEKISDSNLEEVIRVKALIRNAKNEVYLVYNNYTYQFPGGHKKKNETLEEALTRELKEELGVSRFQIKKPFLLIEEYFDAGIDTRNKCKSSIYYYDVILEEEPNKDYQHLDTLEKKTDFKILLVSFDKVSSLLEVGIEKGNTNPIIAREMIKVLEIYKEDFNL